MTKSKILKTLLIILLIIAVIFAPAIFVVLGTLAWMGGTAIYTLGVWIFTPNPPKPEITYGEFPFEIVYEIDGETVTMNDIYICEYDGIELNGGGYEKERMWEGYINGSGTSAILITEDSDRQIFCFVGDAEFYMGDEKYPKQRPLAPRLYDVTKNFNVDSLHPDEIAKFYNIEIVSWSFSEPIENSFG